MADFYQSADVYDIVFKDNETYLRSLVEDFDKIPTEYLKNLVKGYLEPDVLIKKVKIPTFKKLFTAVTNELKSMDFFDRLALLPLDHTSSKVSAKTNPAVEIFLSYTIAANKARRASETSVRRNRFDDSIDGEAWAKAFKMAGVIPRSVKKETDAMFQREWFKDDLSFVTTADIVNKTMVDSMMVFVNGISFKKSVDDTRDSNQSVVTLWSKHLEPQRRMEKRLNALLLKKPELTAPLDEGTTNAV